MTKRPIVAFLYDFDKTLCTTDMEDYAFIPSLGYTPSEFWAKANGFGYENKMDGLLAYMYTMIRECAAQGIRLDRDYLVRSGEAIELFPGVREWFARITAYGADLGVDVEHYVISSGLREIIEGSGIAHEFKQIYACEFYYDESGLAAWPKLDVNFTNKTQFVYRINKGILDIARDKELNDSMPDDSKRVPFTNMVYVGDGLSDVPCMKMMRAYGGQAVAVYQKSNRAGVEKLLQDGRVDFIFPADYREGTEFVRAMAAVAGTPPKKGRRILPTPCAMSSWSAWKGSLFMRAADAPHSRLSIMPRAAMVTTGEMRSESISRLRLPRCRRSERRSVRGMSPTTASSSRPSTAARAVAAMMPISEPGIFAPHFSARRA